MRIAELPPIEHALAFRNPYATAPREQIVLSSVDVSNAFGLADQACTVVQEMPAPRHIRANVGGRTVVSSHGGDGTVQLVVAAAIGHVRDDPEVTASNETVHRPLLEDVLYVPIANGNGNNFACSALGQYAVDPRRLADAPDLDIGFHRPLAYQVTDERGNTVRSGIATSCFGINAAAIVAAKLHQQKLQLAALGAQTVGQQRRFAKETLITARELLNVKPFSADLTVTTGRDSAREPLRNIAGLELIGSHIYAKRGRAPVNIDDPRHQVVVATHHMSRTAGLASLLLMSARLATGQHKRRPLDLTDTTLTLRVISNQPVPFHTDGEIGDTLMIEPGQLLRLRLGNLAVPTLIRR